MESFSSMNRILAQFLCRWVIAYIASRGRHMLYQLSCICIYYSTGLKMYVKHKLTFVFWLEYFICYLTLITIYLCVDISGSACFLITFKILEGWSSPTFAFGLRIFSLFRQSYNVKSLLWFSLVHFCLLKSFASSCHTAKILLVCWPEGISFHSWEE